MSDKTPAKQQEVLIERKFKAPAWLVFEAWTRTEHLLNWYAPHGCDIRFKWNDPKPGGSFLSCISNPSFPDCWCLGEYLSVNPPHELVFSMRVAGEDGQPLNPVEAGMHQDWPEVTIVSITIKPENDETLVRLHQTVSEDLAKKTGAHPSWIQMMDRLDSLLAHQISISENLKKRNTAN